MKQTTTKILPQGYKMTELGPLPEEWEVVRLGEVLDLLRNGITKQQNKLKIGIPISRIETISTGKINTQKVGYVEKLSDDEIEKYKVQKGDILLSHINSEPYLGNSAIYENEPKILIHGMNLLLLRVNKNVLSSEYLNFLFNYYREKNFFIKIASRSVNQSSINQAKIKSLPLPLPPLPEQQKIAAVLSAVQEAKEKTQAVIDATKALKKSMMKHLFTYGPVPPEETENVPLKETEIGKVPEEWKVVKLGEAFEIISKERIILIDDEKKYKQLTVRLYSKGIQLREINVGNKIGVKKQYRVITGDFVFSKIDARNGAYGFIPDELNDGIVSGDFPILKLNKELCNQQFLSYYLSIEKNWIHLRNFAVGTTNRKRVQPKEFLSYLSIPLPPLPIQQKIASILSAIDAKIEAEENKKQALEELFKTLLHNLMTAKIRVDKHRINIKEHKL